MIKSKREKEIVERVDKEERERKMAILDIRQLVAGILTFSMFIMLGNMIKKDHFDPAFVSSLFEFFLFDSFKSFLCWVN